MIVNANALPRAERKTSVEALRDLPMFEGLQ